MSWLEEYKKSLKMTEVEEYPDLFFYRPLAFLVVKLVYNTRITPDNLTLFAIMSGLTGGALYAFGTQTTTILGALFFALFIIFDCSDGQLARLKKNGTPIGRILDGIADYIVVISIYAGIAIGYTRQEGQPSYMLGLLILSGVCVIIHHMLVDFFRTRFLTIVGKRKNILEEDLSEYRNEYNKLKGSKSRWIERNIILIYLTYLTIQEKLTAKRKKLEIYDISPEEYYKKNRLLMGLWLTMGPSAMRTSLIICSLFGRFDIYFWIIIGGFNILAATLWIIQRQFDKSYLIRTK